MHVTFELAVRKLSNDVVSKHLSSLFTAPGQLVQVQNKVFLALLKRLDETTSMDSAPRFDDIARHLVGPVVESLSGDSGAGALRAVQAFRADFCASALELYRSLRTEATEGKQQKVDETQASLGRTAEVYACIRGELDVSVRRGDVAAGKHGRSVGGNISRVVRAVRGGQIIAAVGRAMA